MRIRVILVDDHPIVLQGLEHLFLRHDDFEVVAACGCAEDALQAAAARAPDVVVTDLRMPQSSGLDLLGALRRDYPACRVVLLTAAISDAQVVEAIKLGATGLVMKDAAPQQLIDCVRRVHRGEECLASETVSRALKSVLERETVRGALSRTLTAREIEIIRMVAQGLKNRAVGERLAITEATVKVHLHNIYEKVGVTGRVELLLFAQQKGLV
ncbi:MAG TPA: response regulator transcription factor [Vicinamibacterales bacterium]|nr:response regulator transcription factor [Vicinamibacterales bacterium]